jgi:hypothetical protein
VRVNDWLFILDEFYYMDGVCELGDCVLKDDEYTWPALNWGSDLRCCWVSIGHWMMK